MANLKRNFINLVKEVKEDGTVLFDTYVTPHFIPFNLVYSSIDALAKADDPDTPETEAIDELLNMVVEIYNNQFTRQDLLEKMHSPDAITTLREQVEFVAQGKMDEERKKELKALLK